MRMYSYQHHSAIVELHLSNDPFWVIGTSLIKKLNDKFQINNILKL